MASSQNFSIVPVSLTLRQTFFLNNDGGWFAGVEHFSKHLLGGRTADGLGFDETDEFQQCLRLEFQIRECHLRTSGREPALIDFQNLQLEPIHIGCYFQKV